MHASRQTLLGKMLLNGNPTCSSPTYVLPNSKPRSRDARLSIRFIDSFYRSCAMRFCGLLRAAHNNSPFRFVIVFWGAGDKSQPKEVQGN
jgi:hypothetical protein